VPCYFGNLNEILPHAGGGKINVLAVSGEKRARQMPQVPTVAEQGYAGFRTVSWNGYVAPAATPKAIVERLAREIAAGCRDTAFSARLDKIGVDAVCSTPAEFEQAVREDLATWKEAVQSAGIAPPRACASRFRTSSPPRTSPRSRPSSSAASGRRASTPRSSFSFPSRRPTKSCAKAGSTSSVARRMRRFTRSRTGKAAGFCARSPRTCTGFWLFGKI